MFKPLIWQNFGQCVYAFSDEWISRFVVSTKSSSGVLTMIIIRTLRRDIAQYNQEAEDVEDALEETGWKLVHGDVFRPPKRVGLFEPTIKLLIKFETSSVFKD